MLISELEIDQASVMRGASATHGFPTKGSGQRARREIDLRRYNLLGVHTMPAL